MRIITTSLGAVAALVLISCDNSARMLDCTDGCSNKQGPAGQSIVGAQGPQGTAGIPGSNATPGAYDIVAVTDPCGDALSIADEVLLSLRDGTILASFSANASGDNTRLVRLYPGTFVTSDGSSCVFNVDGSGVITW